VQVEGSRLFGGIGWTVHATRSGAVPAGCRTGFFHYFPAGNIANCCVLRFYVPAGSSQRSNRL